jgi:outer membrane lipoprotein-sorting protein
VNNGEKQLFEYLSPADIRGQRILMTNDGDDIWMFNPETRRTRKLGSHMKKRKVMGSDFTYEDQSGGKLVEKYRGRVIRQERVDGNDCYVLELIPTPKGPSYPKVVIWIGKRDFLTRRVDFYQSNDPNPFKRLICEDIRKAGHKLYPHSMTMTNLEDRTETINIVTQIQFGVDIPKSIFESRNLSR